MRNPASALAALSLLATIAFPAASAAEQLDPPPSSLGRSPRTWVNGGGWYLHLGVAQRDTLPSPLDVTLVAARTALENDNWEMDPARVAAGRLTTRWKPINNFIFRLFSGKAFGRCFVLVQPLQGDSVVVTFQAGLATRRDIEHSPARVLADSTYASAARDWQRKVRKLLALRPTGSEIPVAIDP